MMGELAWRAVMGSRGMRCKTNRKAVRKWLGLVIAGVCMLLTSSSSLWGEDEYERSPVRYSDSVPANRVSQLQQQIDNGEIQLTYDREFGYLRSLLESLKVSTDSQMLVFSKTSLQIQRITPRTPRAIYFSDDVYVGYCQQGEVLEISAVDSKLGTVFYTLDQKLTEQPKLIRQTDHCLTCHSSSRTEGVPGHVARSIFADTRGMPIFSAGSHNVNYRTPLEKRWGGWYVTGKHGQQVHMGNLVVSGRDVPEDLDLRKGSNLNDLSGHIDPDRYLSRGSDIVALMVMEHQIVVQNYLTKANFMTRQALEYQAMMHKELGVPEGELLDSVKSRIRSAGNDLVDALLMVDESPLSEPVEGTSGFAERFSKLGPFDSKGRSLRQLDLSKRLFSHPCSYLIYSDSFRELPAEMKRFVRGRFEEILSGRDSSAKYAHLSEGDRKALVEILEETKVWGDG